MDWARRRLVPRRAARGRKVEKFESTRECDAFYFDRRREMGNEWERTSFSRLMERPTLSPFLSLSLSLSLRRELTFVARGAKTTHATGDEMKMFSRWQQVHCPPTHK